jgi:hypothetical protein
MSAKATRRCGSLISDEGSTVRSILENPRYTGYAIFGRWHKHETRLDPDDVAAGHVVRFRRSTPDRIVRSRRPVKRPYLFRGRVRCSLCRRKMEGSPRKHAMYYRCPAGTLAPESPVLAGQR